MKNNIILLLIDSMNNTHIKESTIELTPFMNKLKKEGVYCESVFSQAPYTEAANMNIYCGTDVLENGGYMFRYKDAPLTIFEAMKKMGYKTYYNDFQPQCHPSSVRRGIDDIFYSVGYDLDALWSYRLSHYAELYKKSNLEEQDYLILEEIFNDNLKEWIRFTEDIKNNDKSTNMIRNNSKEYDVWSVQKQVKEQYELYKKNKREYINAVLTKGKTHQLFEISGFFQNCKITDRTIVPWIRKQYKPLFKRIKKMNFRLNIRNCNNLFEGILKKGLVCIKKPNKENFKNFLKSGYLVWNQLFDSDLYERINKECDSFKNAPSLRTHIDHYITWTQNKENTEPHFAFMHVDDIHNPEVFFTYDSTDKELLKKECINAEKLLNKIPKEYSGSLSHDLSLQYIDGVIKYLYDELERVGLKDKTYVLICADHGFSFSGNPLRDSFVINLYLENYNIPFILTGPDLVKKEVIGLHASKDIPATICGLACGEIPKEFSGIDMVHSEKSYEILNIEYCGGGCPDLSRRKLKLAAFDENYFVGSLVRIDEVVDMTNITEIYDLQNDPRQYKNIVNKLEDFSKIEHLVKNIEKRKNSIKENFSVTNEFLGKGEKND